MDKLNNNESYESIKPFITNDFYRIYMMYIISKHYSNENLNKIVKNNDNNQMKNIAKTYDDEYGVLYKKSDMIATWEDWSTNLFISNVLNNIDYIKNIDNTPYEKFQYFNTKFASEKNADKKLVNEFVNTLLCGNTKILDNEYDNTFLK